jgi:hypothetical protein
MVGFPVLAEAKPRRPADGLDLRPASRQIQKVFADWLLLALVYLWAVFLVSLGVYALTMRYHFSRLAAMSANLLSRICNLKSARRSPLPF